MREGNDYLNDLSKIIYAFFGLYEVARKPDIFGFVALEPPPHPPMPAFQQWRDDEAVDTPFEMTEELQLIFRNWFWGATSLFDLEDGFVWKGRLLYNHAILLLGLMPFQLTTEGPRGLLAAQTLFITGLLRLEEAIGLFVNSIDLTDEPTRRQAGRLVEAYRNLRRQLDGFQTAVSPLKASA